jgi:hypothetical protein
MAYPLVNLHAAELVALLSAQRLQQAGARQPTGDIPPLPLALTSLFRAISAGGRLVVITVCGPVWCQAQATSQLTDAIGLSGATAVEIYYVRTSLAALCNAALCSKRLRGSPVTEQTDIRCEMREALRDIPPTSFACLVLLDGLFARRRHAHSHMALCQDVGEGVFFFSTGPHSSHKAAHEAAHAETEAVAEDGRCCMRTRCVMCDHGAPRRSPQKPRVVDRGHISTGYWVGSAVCSAVAVPEGRFTALICAVRWSASQQSARSVGLSKSGTSTSTST